MRTIFYIDGFNFYYGLRNIKKRDPSWAHFYWIDVVKLCEQFLSPDDILVKVKYFTAPPINVQKRIRQSAFLKVNDLINGEKFEVIRGKYIEKSMNCNLCNGTYTKPEEKRTDVNISVNLMGDTALGKVDKIVLITADSDLVPPIEFIKENYPNIQIKIYFPPSSYSNDLRDAAKNRKIVQMEKNKYRFTNSIIPKIVYSKDGADSAVIPPKWDV